MLFLAQVSSSKNQCPVARVEVGLGRSTSLWNSDCLSLSISILHHWLLEAQLRLEQYQGRRLQNEKHFDRPKILYFESVLKQLVVAEGNNPMDALHDDPDCNYTLEGDGFGRSFASGIVGWSVGASSLRSTWRQGLKSEVAAAHVSERCQDGGKAPRRNELEFAVAAEAIFARGGLRTAQAVSRIAQVSTRVTIHLFTSSHWTAPELQVEKLQEIRHSRLCPCSTQRITRAQPANWPGSACMGPVYISLSSGLAWEARSKQRSRVLLPALSSYHRAVGTEQSRPAGGCNPLPLRSGCT